MCCSGFCIGKHRLQICFKGGFVAQNMQAHIIFYQPVDFGTQKSAHNIQKGVDL